MQMNREKLITQVRISQLISKIRMGDGYSLKGKFAVTLKIGNCI